MRNYFSKGAILGMVLSYAAVLLLGIFTQTARSKGLLPNKQLKSTSIENCPSFNGTFQSAYYYKPSNITITQFEYIKISLHFLNNRFALLFFLFTYLKEKNLVIY